MKYFVIAGETSGDLYGSHLMLALQKSDPEAKFMHWGGDRMKHAGGEQMKDIEDLAIMGFWEVVKNLRTILSNFKVCKEQILHFGPDALILIDYPGFNLRMAEWAKKEGLRVFYYISPQLWAWKARRIEKIKKYVDRLFVILPFEQEYYAHRGVNVTYYGHPLVDIVNEYRRENNTQERRVFGLFPGSRRQEILRMLPAMMQGVAQIDGIFHISMAPSILPELYLSLIADKTKFKVHRGTSYDLMNRCRAALVTSGTATLECALFDTPQVVCYKGSPLSFAIARRVVKVPYISLVNLISDKEVVSELVQSECRAANIHKELNLIIKSDKKEHILAGYDEMRSKLTKSQSEAVPDLIARDIVNLCTE